MSLSKSTDRNRKITVSVPIITFLGGKVGLAIPSASIGANFFKGKKQLIKYFGSVYKKNFIKYFGHL